MRLKFPYEIFGRGKFKAKFLKSLNDKAPIAQIAKCIVFGNLLVFRLFFLYFDASLPNQALCIVVLNSIYYKFGVQNVDTDTVASAKNTKCTVVKILQRRRRVCNQKIIKKC